MTEHNEEMAPITPAKKGLLCSKAFWLVTGGAVTVLIIGMVGAGAVRHVDQRIAQLEKAQKAFAPQDDMTSMADMVQAHAKKLKALTARQTSLSDEITGLRVTNRLPEKLEQQLQVQQVELNALKDSLETLKKSAATAPAENTAPAGKPSVSVPAGSSATAKTTPKHKPTPINSAPRKAVRRVSRKVPFVLTGVEQRGTAAFAAVAPQGFSDLSQVRLIGEGESVAGWTLVRAGHGQATFRVSGHLQTVSAQ
ncbi:hypothetical protein RJ492_004533 [Pluralibacter gergoviae]|uniref:hypothetical protein n=1 Tax=Enterobacterales TaxID=91347 RepID=UPI0007CCFC49|nr:MULTISPECIES: hypothetical protein [Enterobacterales]EKV9909473.1 hypothetical protein [Pluralibacter gergoviae]SAQ03158.1 conjugal transfer pilus assembly protein TraB [Klebsiella oxytoca]HBX4000075.1 hypothetical protein [Klebsiella variicola]ELD4333527.1 hypothetical protein [Pluralibacter gergoviae]MBZ6860897.1 hypothetical protein [Klebsiella michiganensis]